MAIETRHNLQEYFHELIRRSSAQLNLSLAEHAEFYIVTLLDKFRRNEKVTNDQPLALLLEQAVHSEKLAARIDAYRQLGDTALFMAGYFPHQTNRKLVDLDYYIQMGGGAYLSLASIFPGDDTFQEIYGELGSKFDGCVKLIAQIRRMSHGERNADLLDLYERWLKTGCEKLQKLLHEAGIPTDVPQESQ